MSESNFETETISFPPKPELIEKNQSSILRSMISLFLYGLLFYFIFDSNISYIAAILLVIIIHELGHYSFMRLFNYSNVKIFIVPLLGAFTSGKKQKVSQWQLTLIILAGPVPGIIIGCILMWYNASLQNDTLKMLSQIFLVVNLLNCLPIHPLDGGRFIETLFFKENFVIRLAFGIISIVALLFLCIALQSYFILVIPFLIAFELYNENKLQKIRTYLNEEKIDFHVEYENLSDKNYWLMRDCLILSFPRKYGALEPGKYEYTIFENIFVQQTKSILQPSLNLDLKVWSKVAVIIFYFMLLLVPVTLYMWLHKII